MRMYANFAKVEPQDDGTLKVYGYASSGALDSDGETVSPDAMKAAIPDYMKFGAVREMHQPMAAGTAIEAGVDDEGKTTFAAHIVDPIAVKKVTTNVYKGFSIGGKVIKRDPKNDKNIIELRLVEVSLVDRPANPEAIFTMYKAEDLEKPVDAEKVAIADIAELLNTKAILPSQILKASRDSLIVPEARKPLPYDAFKKGMSQVCQFASLLQDAQYLASSAAYEAEYENDGSKVPDRLRAWLATGVSVFTSMAAEETREMLDSLKPPAEMEVATIASADKTGDLEKKGATFSADSKSKLADIHKAMQGVCDKMDALGYKQDDDTASAAAAPDTKAEKTGLEPIKEPIVEKANTATTPDDAYAVELAKDLARGGQVAPIVKTDISGELLKAELAKRDTLIDTLTKRLEVLEAQPMPTKAVLRAVTKGQDIAAPDPDSLLKATDNELPADATPEQRAHAEILKTFRTGGRRLG